MRVDPLRTDLPPLRLKGRALLPIVQGGMGVGVSAHRLAGTVAQLNGVGTIASVDLQDVVFTSRLREADVFLTKNKQNKNKHRWMGRGQRRDRMPPSPPVSTRRAGRW